MREFILQKTPIIKFELRLSLFSIRNEQSHRTFIKLIFSIHDMLIIGKYLRAWNNFKVFTEFSSIKRDGSR